MRPGDTIAAIATAPGRGGIGIVRLSGPRAAAIATALAGALPPPRRAGLVRLHGTRGEPLDQGLLLRFPAPHSYTGEDVVEFHGHGSPAMLRLVLERCLDEGARLAAPGEFTHRAFLNGKLDLAQAEGVADLIDAATATAARAAARSLVGEFSRAVEALVEGLVELRTLTEATLDFPEEDIDFLRRADAAGRLERLSTALADLLRRARQGARLREGLTMVLVGRPNVGKSSLLNRLAGDDVAIVTPIAGTTRDTVRSQIELAGVPVAVVDTAGLRPTDDPIERIGIERTWAAIGHADLALVIVDARDTVAALEEADVELLARLPTGLPRIVVHNKIDLAGLPARCEAPAAAAGHGQRTLPPLAVGAVRRGHRAAAAGASRCSRPARGHGGHGARAGAAPLGAARGGRSPRRGGGAPPRAGAAARTLRRGVARGAVGAGGDHRRVHRQRPAGGDLLALLHREIGSGRRRATLLTLKRVRRRGSIIVRSARAPSGLPESHS